MSECERRDGVRSATGWRWLGLAAVAVAALVIIAPAALPLGPGVGGGPGGISGAGGGAGGGPGIGGGGPSPGGGPAGPGGGGPIGPGTPGGGPGTPGTPGTPGAGGGSLGGGIGVPGPGGVPTCENNQQALSAAEVQDLLLTAAATLGDDRMTVAVVERSGRILGIFRKPGAPAGRDDEAVGLARTAAFFSNNQAPLSSRTVRFISGVHFPPGIRRTPNAALYGIENTNRGCDLNVTFNGGKFVPRATSAAGGRCDAYVSTGCGSGPVTGKPDDFDTHAPGESAVHDPKRVAVNAGGIPIYRGGTLLGGIGVVGVPSNHAEFAAFTAVASAAPPTTGQGLAPVPTPLPAPGVVFIDGVRLPFADQTDRPAGTAPGAANGSFVRGPVDGGCMPDGYLVGPLGGAGLNAAEVDRLVQQAVATAGRTRAVIRLPLGQRARMVIAVGDGNGDILAIFRMPDATVFSIDVAVAKARNVAYFSAAGLGSVVPPGTAVTNRTISFGAQPLFPAGIDGTSPGPFFDIFRFDTANPCSQGPQPPNANQNGIVFFPGSIPLYQGGNGLIGGLGISGDGVEQDDYVAFHGAAGFRPDRELWADQLRVRRVRLPFLKFPRNPEG